jgi:hypothetical protein
VSEQPDLEALRTMIGAQSTRDDPVLQTCLDTAKAWVWDRVRPSSRDKGEVAHAIRLLAARLYKRRQSPEGVAGWDDLGVVRIMGRDPDIERLLEQHVDAYKTMGIA